MTRAFTRTFEVDQYEPVEGAYTDVEAPINEAYLDIRDAVEVYGHLFGRRTTSSTTAGIRDGDPVIREMALKSTTREHYSSTILEGTVEAQDGGPGTTIEYAFTVEPSTLMEYAFISALLDPQDGKKEPADILPDAGIVLDEEDLGTMLRQGTLQNAEGRAATYIEEYARADNPHDRLEPGDMAAAEAYADWMGHPFNPEQHRIAPAHTATHTETSRTVADGGSQEWAFRTVLTDRSREKKTVTYTVELQADDSDDPFTGNPEEAGTITFTVPAHEETLQKTWERYRDST